MAFASSMLNAQHPALSESPAVSADSIIQTLATNSQMKPEVRASHLLRLASCYLTNTPLNVVDAQFANIRADVWVFSDPEKWESNIENWADQISRDVRATSSGTKTKLASQLDPRSISNRKFVLANTAIQKAMAQLEKTSESFAKLNLYYIASRLFQKIGNTDATQKCNKVLETALQACEKNKNADVEQIRAASSVLNLMANELISIRVADANSPLELQMIEKKPFAEMVFKQCEQLKLRSVAVADKLPAKDHNRRKAHRDLAIWYMVLGNNEKAVQQKQILFKLVGVKDDNVLYPHQVGCGHLAWWVTKRSSFHGACGMG